jgi:biopolymer transport protein ExbB/TolQ
MPIVLASISGYMDILAKNFHSGGPFMFAIAFLLFVAIAIGLERTYALFMKLYVDGVGFMATVQKLLVSGKIQQAVKVCNYHRKTALARVIGAGLSVANQGEDALQDAIDEATLDVLPDIQKRTVYLQMIANVATLLGLLGTIVGLIQAFAGLTEVDPASRQDALGQGISVALNTTAFGLMVAIPAMIFHSILMARTLKMVDEIDRFSVKLVNLLIRLFGRTGKGRTPGGGVAR